MSRAFAPARLKILASSSVCPRLCRSICLATCGIILRRSTRFRHKRACHCCESGHRLNVLISRDVDHVDRVVAGMRNVRRDGRMASERRHGRNRPRRGVPAGRYDRVNEAPSLRASLRVTTPHQQLASCAEGSRHPETSLFRSVTLCEVPTAYFQAEAENRMSNRRVFH